MNNYLKKLQMRHRRIDRFIDTSKSVGKQEEVKTLKRIRLLLKDQIAELQSRSQSVPQ